MEKHLVTCTQCPRDIKSGFFNKINKSKTLPMQSKSTGATCSKTKSSKEIMTAGTIQNDGNIPKDINDADGPSTSHSQSSSLNKDEVQLSDEDVMGIAQTVNEKNREQSQRTENDHSFCSNGSIIPFFDNITSAEQIILDEHFARALYTSGVPFSAIVENVDWLEFLKKLRPAYKVPTRHMIAKPLLDKEYNGVRTNVETKIENSNHLCLQTDGWSNIRNESVLNFIISTPSPYIVDTVFPGKNQHTAEYLADTIIGIIEKFNPNKFFALVTDNASNMIASSRIVTQRFPHMYSYGCIAHMINLIAYDLMKTKSGITLLTKAKEFIKLVCNTQVLNALFKEICKTKNVNISLKLPVVTRWGSVKECFESLLKTRSALRALSISEEAEILVKKMNKKKRTEFNHFKISVLSDEFWDQINSFLTILNPLKSWILILEKDQPTIELTCSAFKDIESNLNTFLDLSVLSADESTTLRDKMMERKSLYLKDLHFAADLLRPKSVGSNLRPAQLIKAMKCIEKISTDLELDVGTVSQELEQFINHSNIWSEDFLWEKTEIYNSISWWKLFCKDTKLHCVAVRVLSMPATSAATERSFKTQSLIQTKKRNRITNENVKKLTYFKHNLNLIRRTIKSTCFKKSEPFEEEDFYESTSTNEEDEDTGEIYDDDDTDDSYHTETESDEEKEEEQGEVMDNESEHDTQNDVIVENENENEENGRVLDNFNNDDKFIYINGQKIRVLCAASVSS